MYLRAQQGPRAKVWVPPQARASETSKDNLIRMLTARLKGVEAENRELRTQVEVAYGLVHAQSLRTERAPAAEVGGARGLQGEE